MRLLVAGAGAVGARAARQLLQPETTELVVVDAVARQAETVVNSLGPPARVAAWDPARFDGCDVVVLALPGDAHPEMAAAAVAAGAHVVSVADDVSSVRALLALDDEARRHDRTIVVGAGFAPGLSCLLARHAAAGFDAVDEVHVAKAGTGGPACARHHHRALRGEAIDWHLDGWAPRAGGSGRELCWFPEPIGAQDCYRAALPDPLVLAPAFPGVRRVTARVAASRRDRVTSRLPMLRRPHPEGVLGALRVEVRGRRGAATDARVLGALDRPGVAGGTVAALAAVWLVTGQLSRSGAGGLAELVVDPVPFLHELARRGVRAAAFHGAGPQAEAAS